ncbi:MAG: hypothetical protein ACT4PW_01730 [Acidimicrobiia bacterium]
MKNGAYQVMGLPAPAGAPFALSRPRAAAGREAAVPGLTVAWPTPIDADKPATPMFVNGPDHRTRRPWEPSQ